MKLALVLAWCLAGVRSSPGRHEVLSQSGFLALAVRPELPQRPATPFGALMALSVTATTVGCGGAHRLVPYTHDALVTDRTAAEASTQAIRDIVDAARFATALKKS